MPSKLRTPAAIATTAAAGAPHFVRLAAQASPAQLRTETYKGDEHIVVPTVLLVGDIVVQGMNSEAPEFVPSDVLAAAPSGLDGRPVVNVHPANGQEGANTPDRWEHEVFGQCWNSHFTNGALQTELWLNRAQAERVGPDAVEVLDKALAGEIFEVSIGAWVWLTDEAGVSPNGERYAQRWQSLVHDHAAAGLQAQGGVGACSATKHGCGGPRVLSAAQATEIKERTTNMNPSALARLAAALGKDAFVAYAEGMSDNELRRKLNKALRSIVPGFWGVEEVFDASSSAIYAAMPDDNIEFWECSFSVEGDKVNIGRRKRVEPVTEWKKVAAADKLEQIAENLSSALDGLPAPVPATSTSANTSTNTNTATAVLKDNCKCQDHASTTVVDGAAASGAPPTGIAAPNKGTKGASMSDKIKELVGRLTGNSATKLTDADVDALTALGEEKLAAMAELIDKPAVEVVKEVAPTTDPNLVTFTAAEASAMRKALAREQDREKIHRAGLTKALVDSGVCKYTEAQLAKKDTEDLELLAESLGVLGDTGDVRDFTGRGLHAALRTEAESANDAAPPNVWGLDANTAKLLGYKPSGAAS